MNRKSRTAACRSPEQTRPRLLKEYRAPAAAACSHAAAGSTHHARMPSDRELPPPGGPRFAQPGRPTREWSGRLAQTRGQDRQDYVQHGPGRPSVGETPANTVDVFLASAAPPARDSGCPPNRVNPNPAPELGLDDRLRELSIGSWDGLTYIQIAMCAPGIFAGDGRSEWCFRSPDGERYEGFAARVGDWLSEPVDAPLTIVVTHGMVSRVLR